LRWGRERERDYEEGGTGRGMGIQGRSTGRMSNQKEWVRADRDGKEYEDKERRTRTGTRGTGRCAGEGVRAGRVLGGAGKGRYYRQPRKAVEKRKKKAKTTYHQISPYLPPCRRPHRPRRGGVVGAGIGRSKAREGSQVDPLPEHDVHVQRVEGLEDWGKMHVSASPVEENETSQEGRRNDERKGGR
jgi:hypothetical protein